MECALKWISRLKIRKTVQGLATWSTGGATTKCGIPWTYNEGMTTAVGDKSPYKCGQVLKVKNKSTQDQKEIMVVVVDQVKGFADNKLNLHKKAFEALGSSASVGIIEIEITPIG